MTIEERQAEIIEEMTWTDDWMERYQMIIDMGKELDGYPDTEKNEGRRIKGCQSNVWLLAEEEDGLIKYKADSDAIITKGLVSLMIRVLSGRPAQEIVESDLHFIRDIGLQEHLSPTRSNGLAAMVKQMKMYALGLQAFD